MNAPHPSVLPPDATVAAVDESNPWLGLASFTEETRAFFYGRDEEVATRLEEAQAKGLDPTERGATWTYLTTDQPFGDWSQRILRGLLRKVQTKSLWG